MKRSLCLLLVTSVLLSACKEEKKIENEMVTEGTVMKVEGSNLYVAKDSTKEDVLGVSHLDIAVVSSKQLLPVIVFESDFNDSVQVGEQVRVWSNEEVVDGYFYAAEAHKVEVIE